MLEGIRGRFPAVIWTLVAVALVAGGWLVARQPTGRSIQDELASHIVIKFEDTGDEIKMVRGMFEREMMARGIAGTADAAVGITNPKTGKPTGFPADRDYWNQIVAAAKELQNSKPKGVPASR